MAETLRDAAAAAVSDGGPFGSSVRSAATPEQVSSSIDGPRDGLELLAEELRVAAIEAEKLAVDMEENHDGGAVIGLVTRLAHHEDLLPSTRELMRDPQQIDAMDKSVGLTYGRCARSHIGGRGGGDEARTVHERSSFGGEEAAAAAPRSTEPKVGPSCARDRAARSGRRVSSAARLTAMAGWRRTIHGEWVRDRVGLVARAERAGWFAHPFGGQAPMGPFADEEAAKSALDGEEDLESLRWSRRPSH